MDEKTLTKLINKMIGVIKPKHVLDIKYTLEPMGDGDDDHYYMSINYIVPDDSPLLKMGKSLRSLNDIKMEWNHEIKKSIKNYFNVDVIINSTGMSSESYHNNQKEN